MVTKMADEIGLKKEKNVTLVQIQGFWRPIFLRNRNKKK